MKNVTEKIFRDQMYNRIDNIEETDKALWGEMDVSEMVCHLADQLRVAFGEIKVKDKSNFFTRNVFSRLVLLGGPLPKGKIKTFPEIDQALGKGATKTELAGDKDILKKRIENFANIDNHFQFQQHSIFGRLNKQQWGRLIYLHLDHHLKQFGC